WHRLDSVSRQPKTIYACSSCGSQSPKWLGRCPDCNEWNTFVEDTLAPAVPAAAGAKHPTLTGGASHARRIDEVDITVAERIPSGIGEFDRVLGGGIVPGSLVLIGGEPGIGKSTLLLQAAAHFAHARGSVLYASGEESEHQIKARGERLGVGAGPLYLLSETCL